MPLSNSPEIAKAALSSAETVATPVVPSSTADLTQATGERISGIGDIVSKPAVGATLLSLLHLGILWTGLKMIVTGKRPKILGGKD